MKHRWPYAVLSVVGMAAIVVVLAWVFRPREPVHQGKPLSYWVDRFGNDIESHTECQAAFRAIGPKAIPFLMSRARRQDAMSQRLYRAVWPRLPGVLQRRIRQPDPISYAVHRRIGFILGGIGQPALPTVLTALQDRNEGARLVAVQAMGRIAPKSDGAVRLVENLVADSNRLTRVYAVLALGRMNPNSVLAVPALIRALRDSDVTVRAHAAVVLGELGPQARDAVPELRNLLNMGDSYTRQPAAVALWRIDRDTNSVPPLIAELKQAIQPGPRLLFPRPASTGPGLRFSNPATTCQVCLKTFAEMGPQAKAAVPAIMEAIRTVPRLERRGLPVALVIRWAREALEQIDPEGAAKLEPEAK
jgi:HEAT repeat protein